MVMTAMLPKLTLAEEAIGGRLPSRRDEAWKWTDIRGMVSKPVPALSRTALPKFSVPDGVTVSEHPSDDLDTDTPMAKLARQLGGGVWTLNVPENFASKEALIIEDFGQGHARIRLNLAKGAHLSMIENHSGGSGHFSNIDITLNLDERAKVERVIIQNDTADAVRIATSHITAWANAQISQFTLSTGGALSRLETRLAIMGIGVEAMINGAYLLGGNRHCDMTSYIDLTAPNAVVRQAVKGVATDKARGVFQGKFHVRRPAQHTDAEMRHDALMLSETCEIRSKPELEIYADDVACAHGNTIGQLDESVLFYMRQRGIPKKQARALLTEAFVGGVFDDMSDDAMVESLLSIIRDWLADLS